MMISSVNASKSRALSRQAKCQQALLEVGVVKSGFLFVSARSQLQWHSVYHNRPHLYRILSRALETPGLGFLDHGLPLYLDYDTLKAVLGYYAIIGLALALSYSRF